MRTFYAILGVFLLGLTVATTLKGQPETGALTAMTFYAVVSDKGVKRVLNSLDHPNEFLRLGFEGVKMPNTPGLDAKGEPNARPNRVLFVLTSSRHEAERFEIIKKVAALPDVGAPSRPSRNRKPKAA